MQIPLLKSLLLPLQLASIGRRTRAHQKTENTSRAVRAIRSGVPRAPLNHSLSLGPPNWTVNSLMLSSTSSTSQSLIILCD